ncbi:hypothetical protein D3C86_1833220 [compost metagenome]
MSRRIAAIQAIRQGLADGSIEDTCPAADFDHLTFAVVFEVGQLCDVWKPGVSFGFLDIEGSHVSAVDAPKDMGVRQVPHHHNGCAVRPMLKANKRLVQEDLVCRVRYLRDQAV